MTGDPPAQTPPPSRRPSLRRHLLIALLVPLMLLLLINSLIIYVGALIYTNHVHDRSLLDDTLALTQMLLREGTAGGISPQVRFLLEYEPHEGHNYFSITSSKHGLLAGSGAVLSPAGLFADDHKPRLFNVQVKYRELRAAALQIVDPSEPDDLLTVTLAESLHDRHEQAMEILLLNILAQTVLILAVFTLVWFGVGSSLRLFDSLAARLAAREHELTPIGDDDVPIEILPLTRTIDGLFARLRKMLLLQERFIADAAHQLRTPLAGLRVHAERAQNDPTPAIVDDALKHIQRLTLRAGRTSNQLLALTRAQSSELPGIHHEILDLNVLLPRLVSQRVHEALIARIDLGYAGAATPALIDGDPTILQELLDNLLDNALRYAGPGSIVTVMLRAAGETVSLSVEDNGPGVPEAFLERLGERFFRVPGSRAEGSGLGLAIVQRMAQRHRASVRYANRELGGFRVEVLFPAGGA